MLCELRMPLYTQWRKEVFFLLVVNDDWLQINLSDRRLQSQEFARWGLYNTVGS